LRFATRSGLLLAVHRHDVAERAGVAAVVIDEDPAARVDRHVLEQQRDVVDPVAARAVGCRRAWEAQSVLALVLEDVEPGEAAVHVRAGDVDGVVVVPQRRRPLVVVVGIEVRRRLAGQAGVLRVAVGLGVRVDAMQVDDRAGRAVG
jgi:hypothetical protein